jgi:hypothetical protein
MRATLFPRTLRPASFPPDYLHSEGVTTKLTNAFSNLFAFVFFVLFVIKKYLLRFCGKILSVSRISILLNPLSFPFGS